MDKVVALFVTCLVDNLRPKVGFDTIALLEDAGYNVVVPQAQVCCGQPNYNSGDEENAKKVARFVIDTFLSYPIIIAPSGSCAGMIKVHYPKLLSDEPSYASKAQELADKVFELSQFLDEVGYQPAKLNRTVVTYHDACAGLRELGVKAQPRSLLNASGAEIKELQETESCCGFGGTFCVKYPAISAAMVDKKIEDIQATECDMVVAGDLGCLLNIEGRLQRLGSAVAAKHFAEVLADGLAESQTTTDEAEPTNGSNTSQGATHEG